MQARDQLTRLLRIQELALAHREAQKVVDGAPARIEQIEARFRERNAEYVAVKEQFDELEQDQTHRTGELTGLEEQRNKYMEDLMGVKNQREYATMLREIDSVKSEIAGHEEAIINDMEGIERLKGELVTHEEHIKLERVAVAKERAEVEAEAKMSQTRTEGLTTERNSIESELPRNVLSNMRLLESRRQGVFLSKADGGTCMSCFVRIRPQMFQEIKLATAVHACGNCRRYLYYEPGLKPPSETAAAQDRHDDAEQPGSAGMKAVDGGAG